MEKQLTIQPEMQVKLGKTALRELRNLIKNRPDKLVINGRQYLFFSDWQILGAFFGITTYITETSQLTEGKPSKDGSFTLLEPIGYKARAVAKQDGKDISAGEAICLFEEQNWKGKPKFQVLSMAETRACAKALRNCLQWVVRLPTSEFAEEAAEEVQHTDKKQTML